MKDFDDSSMNPIKMSAKTGLRQLPMAQTSFNLPIILHGAPESSFGLKKYTMNETTFMVIYGLLRHRKCKN